MTAAIEMSVEKNDLSVVNQLEIGITGPPDRERLWILGKAPPVDTSAKVSQPGSSVLTTAPRANRGSAGGFVVGMLQPMASTINAETKSENLFSFCFPLRLKGSLAVPSTTLERNLQPQPPLPFKYRCVVSSPIFCLDITNRGGLRSELSKP